MFLYSVLFISGALIINVVSLEDQQAECSIRYSTGTLITKTDMKLQGHQREILVSKSFPQCTLCCVQKDWCISINFETTEHKGVCELNNYGVESEFLVSADKKEFEVSKGFVYSQLRPSQVRFVFSLRLIFVFLFLRDFLVFSFSFIVNNLQIIDT